MVFINECKPCKISNQMLFCVFIFENKRRSGYEYGIKLFILAI